MKDTLYSQFVTRPAYIAGLKSKIPETLHNLFEQKDAELVLAEGTSHFQSIDFDQRNIQTIYPPRDQSQTRKALHLEASANKGPVIIFNTETLDPRNVLFASNPNKERLSVDTVLKELADLEAVTGQSDYDVIILSETARERYFRYSFEGVK